MIMSETRSNTTQTTDGAGEELAAGQSADPFEPAGRDDAFSADPPRGGRSFRFWLYPLLAVVIALALQSRGASPVDWSQDFEASRALAAREGKPMLVAFSSKSCPPCIAMERTVLSKPRVTKALERFVPVKVDVWETPEFAHRYQVQFTPSYGVLTPDGKMWAGHAGPAEIDEFVAFLDKGYANIPTNALLPVTQPEGASDTASAPPDEGSGDGGTGSGPHSLTAGRDDQ